MIHASDLIGARVRTDHGDHLGTVHDLRAEHRDGAWHLTGLVIGHDGLRTRLLGGEGPAVYDGDPISWESILTLEDDAIVVRA